jgi:hypothetical protein
MACGDDEIHKTELSHNGSLTENMRLKGTIMVMGFLLSLLGCSKKGAKQLSFCNFLVA